MKNWYFCYMWQNRRSYSFSHKWNFSERIQLNEDEPKSTGVISFFKSNKLFNIILFQIKYFDTKGEMVSKFKDIKKAFSDKKINDNL